MTTRTYDIGDSVCCDLCNQEWRGIATSGGYLFGSYAVCPDCAHDFLATIDESHERHLIRAWCPPTSSFHAWVMGLRGGDNSIKIVPIDEHDSE